MTLITPCGRVVVVICSGGLLTVILRFAVVLAGVGVCESVTLTVKFDVATTVGVPLIAPLDGFRVSPVGRLPDVMVHW